MNYGIPYMGSKNKIAEKIISQLPPAEHFYDLFGGGGAISHCALESGKYKYIHYNELNPLTFKAFNMAINGEFKNENRWISKEDFDKLKTTDPYVALCFSFGNNGKNYCYSTKIESFKKALHYAICFNDFSLLEQLNVFIDNKLQGRLAIIKAIKEFLKIKKLGLQSLERLENTERLESLKRLERLENLENLQTTNLDYRDVKIEDNSIIYCDPPYINTGSYLIDFNHNEFYEWCRNQKNCFISEYTMPDDFYVYYSISKKCKFNGTKDTVEKLFTVNKMNVYNDLDLDNW